MMEPTTLVLGANGKTGRRVAERLAARGFPLRRGSRSGSPPFDWESADSWGPALTGIEQVYVTFQPDLAVPRAASAIEAFTELATRCGVKRLVLLSGRGELGAQACERIVMKSGIDWTVVRASWFDQNFSEGHFLDPIRAGVFPLPVGSVREPFVDADDIADVVVAALSDARHAGQLYEVTGPRALSFADAVRAIGEACRREIRYVQVTPEEYRAGMLQAGVPAEAADFVIWLTATVLDGRNSAVAVDLERVLGRAPRDFTEYARAAARTGIWSAA